MEDSLNQSSGSRSSKKPNFDGKQAAAELLAGLPQEDRERLLVEIAREDPALAVSLQNRATEVQSGSFDELLAMDETDLALVLSRTPRDELALALRGIDDERVQEILKLIPKRAAEEVFESIRHGPKQKLADVLTARRSIAKRALDSISDRSRP